MIFNIVFLVYFISNRAINGEDMEGTIHEYFSEPVIKRFVDEWKLHKAPMENALESILVQTFGNREVNLQLKNETEALEVTDGLFIFDNVVHVLFKDLHLSRLPHLKNPRVVFSLPTNVLRVEATVTKMLVETRYLILRNQTSFAYTTEKHKVSPFSLQEVKSRGQAAILSQPLSNPLRESSPVRLCPAVDGSQLILYVCVPNNEIIAEYCNLSGSAVARLQGESVYLGQGSFRLTNCQFSIEISAPELGSPPIIAPYFAEGLGYKLESVLIKPIQNELMSKLRISVLSYVNVTSTFATMLPEVRHLQQNLFKRTTNYMSNVIKSLNKATGAQNVASEPIEPLEISWTDEVEGRAQHSVVKLTDLVLSGLDTAYSTHTGGAYKVENAIRIGESIRFNSLHVRGSGHLKVNNAANSFLFSGEVQDFTCHVTFRVNKLKNEASDGNYALEVSKDVLKFEPRGWRYLGINGPNSPLVNTYALISGYLSNKVPEIVMLHMTTYLRQAVKNMDRDISNEVNNNVPGVDEAVNIDDNDNGSNGIEQSDVDPKDDGNRE